MRVRNMTSPKGNKIVNQFIVEGVTIELPNDSYTGEIFQSYGSVIMFKAVQSGNSGSIPTKIFLDKDDWDYSNTAGKYRNLYLGESKYETEKKIKSGKYTLVDLNPPLY